MDAVQCNFYAEVTVKEAEDDESTIIRCYEPYNRRSAAKLFVNFPFDEIYECDLLERELKKANVVDNQILFTLKPFEIRSFKILNKSV